jgi:hypothetical protein
VPVHVFDQGIPDVLLERYHIFSLYRGVFLNYRPMYWLTLSTGFTPPF